MPARMPLGLILLPSVAFAAGLACAWVVGWADGQGENAPVRTSVQTASEDSPDTSVRVPEDSAPAWDLDRAIGHLRSLTATDVTRALDAAGIDDPLAAEELRLAELARHDVDVALAEALAWPGDSDEQFRLAEAVIATAASVDPARAVAAVVAEDAPIVDGSKTESELLGVIWEAWASADLPGLRRELLTNPYWKSRRGSLYEVYYSHAMAKHWPTGEVARWLRLIAELTLPTEPGVLDESKLEDFGAAAEDIEHYQDPRVSDLSELVALPPSIARDAALVFATRFMDATGAMSVPELVSERFRDLAVVAAAQTIARDEARLFEAVDFLGRNSGDDSDLPEGWWALVHLSADALVHDWVRQAEPDQFVAFADWASWLQWTVLRQSPEHWSPGDRAGLVAMTNDGQASGRVLRDHIHSWTTEDPSAASEWVAEMGDHPAGQAAIEGFVLGTAQSDPGAAAVWATEIADPGLRERMTRLAFGYWIESDPAGALAALPSSGLAPGSVEALAVRAEEGGAP